MQFIRLFLLFQKYALYLPLMKKKTPQKRVLKAVQGEIPLNVQQEQFLQKTQTAVLLYLFQDGEVSVMNSFPHLSGEKILLNGEAIQDFHVHEFAEIILLIKGYLMHEVNGGHHILSPGTLVFVRPYDLHRLLPVNSARVVFASLMISSAVVRDLMEYLAAPAIANRFNTASEAPCVLLAFEEARTLMLQMESISTEQVVNPENSTPMARALAAQLFAQYLGRSATAQEEHCVPPLWLSKLREAAEGWEDLQDAIQRLHSNSRCHPSHLCKTFRKYYKETPTDFINRLRLRKAARLLSEPEAKVVAVAAELGFESVSHFHHLFKRYFGLTPAEYRRTMH
jgi:AraC-like DNA-binding protein/quercetin dioxygenase-like cupin family protein